MTTEIYELKRKKVRCPKCNSELDEVSRFAINCEWDLRCPLCCRRYKIVEE